MTTSPSARGRLAVTAVISASALMAGGLPTAAQAAASPSVAAPAAYRLAAHQALKSAVPAATTPVKGVASVNCAKIKYKRFGKKKLPVAGFCGRKMSHVEMVSVLRKAGWSWQAMPNALATFMAESDGYVLAYHLNRAKDGRILSTDVSWTQINDRYHAIRTVNYADPVVAARFARGLANRYGLKIWVGYQHRVPHLKKANAAIRSARAHGVR